MCKKCIDDYCKDESCMVCSKPMKQEDVINLLESGSAFSSHNKVEAEKYYPVFNS